jgi:hypothetical protein
MRIARWWRAQFGSLLTRLCMSIEACSALIGAGKVHMISSPMVLITRPPWRRVISLSAASTAEVIERACKSPSASNSLVLPAMSANKMVIGRCGAFMVTRW